MQALLTGEVLSSQQAEALNIITKYIPKAELETYVDRLLEALVGLELRDIMMYKDIVSVAIRDEEAGSQLELRYFLERASEDKTQAIIKAFIKSGGQTEREATDFQGVFADTAAELVLNLD